MTEHPRWLLHALLAAVNDQTNSFKDQQRVGNAMEGVVIHIRRTSPKTDILHLHFAMEEFFTDFDANRLPDIIAIHERIAEHYKNPSVNIAKEVWERVKAGQFTWANGIRDVHPSPFGTQIYARAISRLMDAQDAQMGQLKSPKLRPLPKPLYRDSYAFGHYVDIKNAQPVKGFQFVEQWKPSINAGTRDGFVNVPALTATTQGSSFRFRFNGTAVGIMIAAGPDAGIVRSRIDNGQESIHDTFTAWSGGLYLPWALVLADGLKATAHEIEVTLDNQHHPGSKGNAVHIMYMMVNGDT